MLEEKNNKQSEEINDDQILRDQNNYPCINSDEQENSIELVNYPQQNPGIGSRISSSIGRGFRSLLGKLISQQHQEEVKFQVKSHPIYLLGECYNKTFKPKGQKAVNQQDKKLFKAHFQAIPWITYRKDFKPLLEGQVLPPSMDHKKLVHRTSDAGWGCMIRTGQMIVCQALIRHVFENKIVSIPSILENQEHKKEYFDILKLFMDNQLGKSAPFSIQNIAQMGLRCQRVPGDWYGPGTISYVMRKLNKSFQPYTNFEIIICQDGILYIDEVKRKARRIKKEKPQNIKQQEQQQQQKKQMPKFNSCLILVPARLGLQKFDSQYSESIFQFFKLPQCVGIIGGRPRFALYFVGIQKKNLLYLDPHYTQKAFNRQKIYEKLKKFQCSKHKTISLGKVDTSLAFGFYVQNQEQFDALIEKLINIENQFKGLMTIIEEKPANYQDGVQFNMDGSVLNQEQVGDDQFVLV